MRSSGYGDGDGDGSGYGCWGHDYDGAAYGYVYGYGVYIYDGWGDGYGDGPGGYGSGDGYGCRGYGYVFSSDSDGSVSGYGEGYGCSPGYGDGSGSGDGDEQGAEDYLSQLLSAFVPQDGEVMCFWNSLPDGRPANGGRAAGPVSVGEVQRVDGPLILCGPGALHGTFRPTQWQGKRTWVVALKKPVLIDDDKLGSLERRIVADLGLCGLNNERPVKGN